MVMCKCTDECPCASKLELFLPFPFFFFFWKRWVNPFAFLLFFRGEGELALHIFMDFIHADVYVNDQDQIKLSYQRHET